MPSTRSQSKAAVISQEQPTTPSSPSPPKDDTVPLIYILLDRDDRDPFVADIPRKLYEGLSQECLVTFKDYIAGQYDVMVKVQSLKFWAVKSPPLVTETESWVQRAKSSQEEFHQLCTRIWPPMSFSKALSPWKDEDNTINLVITIRGNGSTEISIDDTVPELKEFNCYSKTLLNPGPGPHQGAESTWYYEIQIPN